MLLQLRGREESEEEGSGFGSNSPLQRKESDNSLGPAAIGDMELMM